MKNLKVRIIYFSGTGNTQVIAEDLRRALVEGGVDDTELITWEKGGDGVMSGWEGADVLGLAFPVYDYRPPAVIQELISLIPEQSKPRPAFVLSSYGLDARDCNARTALELRKKNYRVIASKSFASPSPVLSFYSKHLNHILPRGGHFERDIRDNVRDFAESIIIRTERFPDSVGEAELPLKPFSRFWEKMSKMTFGNAFYRNLRISSDCTGCGACTDKCPVDNIRNHNERAELRRNGHCMRCLACVQVCPMRAINFTSRKRRGDYGRETARRLYSAC